MAKYWQKKRRNIFSYCIYAVLDKYRQLFVTIDIKEAEDRGFQFEGNIYGDGINYLNCRSIWRDNKGRPWGVKQLGK